ncbi:MAG: GNAT family acetyltransferase [Rhodospirillales bacterium]|nr:GNAT family acetyltransferase [Rhodospirillales bacterium]
MSDDAPPTVPAIPALNIRPFREADRPAVKSLWQDCKLIVPPNDPDIDIDFCRAARHAALFIGLCGGKVVATTMAGYDGRRGWLYYVATTAAERRRGVGRAMLAHAEAWLAARSVPKINLMIRADNTAIQGFYATLGYQAEARTVMGKRLVDPARPKIEIVVTYLEMTALPRLAPPPNLPVKLAVLRAEKISLSFYRYLYNTVGAAWLWYERRLMDDATLDAILADPNVEVYVLYANGEPAGYAELDRRQAPDIELAYFGIVPHWIGRGLGPVLLNAVIDTAWRHQPQRLWVHTCNLDHPKALAMYQRAGFTPYRQETKTVDDPRPYMQL